MSDFLIKNWQKKARLEKKALRDAFGQAILELGEKHKDVVALSADLISSTRLGDFKKRFPQRFFQMGVAEQNMIGAAAGLAIVGWTPFTASFGVFSPGRCLDQIRVQVCINNLNVKLVGSHIGLSHPLDGVTAQATEDIAIMRSLPRMTVVFPADFNQMLKAVGSVYKHKGPVYLRMTREPTSVFIKKQAEFEFAKAQILKTGKDVTLVSAGPLLYESLLAVQKIKSDNIDVEVINLHTIKPIDKEIIVASVRRTGCLITVEDHQIQGGIGSAVAEVVSKSCPVPIEMIGLDNRFGRTARDYQELLKSYKLTADCIAERILSFKKERV